MGTHSRSFLFLFLSREGSYSETATWEGKERGEMCDSNPRSEIPPGHQGAVGGNGRKLSTDMEI